ncbi:MAG TPA: carbon starvation CstA 5TM domain-containing protein, partial [Thermoplasmataceae archaeon]|nr:carbon starvation CstA 5TM domain-containing protein [Thermoplasmataceae archaeon]
EIFSNKRGEIRKPLQNRHFATMIVVVTASLLTFFKPGGQGAMVLWPLFGSLNQLMAALALGVVTVYLYSRRTPIYYTLLPMIVILILTVWAMVKNLIEFATEGEWLLVVMSGLILLLTAWLAGSSFIALVRKRS